MPASFTCVAPADTPVAAASYAPAIELRDSAVLGDAGPSFDVSHAPAELAAVEMEVVSDCAALYTELVAEAVESVT